MFNSLFKEFGAHVGAGQYCACPPGWTLNYETGSACTPCPMLVLGQIMNWNVPLF